MALVTGMVVAGGLAPPRPASALTGASLARDAAQDQNGGSCANSAIGIRLSVTGNINDQPGSDFGAIALFDGSGNLLVNNQGPVQIGPFTISFPVPLQGITRRPVVFRILELTNDNPITPPILSAPVLTSLTVDPAGVFSSCAAIPLASVPTLPPAGLAALAAGLAGVGLWARCRRAGATPPA